MPELYLVRHGQASFGAANYDQLSPLGFQQGRMLGEYFAERDIHFDRVITGDMVRHKQTLHAIQEGMGLTPTEPNIVQGWNEFDFHQLSQLFLADKPHLRPSANSPRRAFFDILKASLHAWAEGTLPALELKETWQEFEARVVDGLNQIAGTTPRERVLVVSSGGAIAMALRHILKAQPETMIALNLQTANTAVSRCFYNQNGFSLHSFNHLPHLDSIDRARHISFS